MRELIYMVVESFYKKATTDVLIGYHFTKFLDESTLAPHLERITGFWEMQLTGKSTVSFDRPFHLLFTHLQLGLKPGELGRWIILFHETLHELEKEIKRQGSEEEIKSIELFTSEWKKRIAFFEERFKAHPQMFNKNF